MVKIYDANAPTLTLDVINFEYMFNFQDSLLGTYSQFITLFHFTVTWTVWFMEWQMQNRQG